MHAKKLFLAAVSVMICSMTHAEQATVGALGAIQSNTILLQAKVREAQAQAELKKFGGYKASEFSADYKYDELGSTDIPYSSGAGGAYGKFTATFVYSNGSQIEAGVGQKIPGGFKVSSITAEQAIITNGKRTFYLPYGMKPNNSNPETNLQRAGSPQTLSLPGQSGAAPRPALMN
ncbi:hypothetical protein OO256_26625 [Pseudomonas sp. DCB_CB]|uniref:hypothetical protein n=1 Tax=unclassified Pseudomonas TaxID=196821 RepID=UPI00224918C4|nr:MULTISPECIES: hypothetical protein [unclassified Pseudomonas]MCX2694510.1 hypothetical protein [Pseudomonas sp. DCB_BZ]MCX2859660.1 hypothetical protein [Pseudomonas sp. DCB_CB]